MKAVPCRLWILPALHAPVAVVIRRKPHKVFHVMRWNTATGELDHGDWLEGLCYPLRCDISPDGRHWVYHAHDVNGLAKVPSLTRLAQWENHGAHFGGGYFASDELVKRRPLIGGGVLSSYARVQGDPPGIKVGKLPGTAEPLELRLKRDGWRSIGAKAWERAPTPAHPSLRMRERSSAVHGQTHDFELEHAPTPFNASLFWATWDCEGRLLAARRGVLERYAPEELGALKPGFAADLNDLTVPQKVWNLEPRDRFGERF